jgi:hypothetical protein
MRYIAILLQCILCYSKFLNIKFGAPFKIKRYESKINIDYAVNANNHNLLKKINGFYGLIGPDINTTTVSSLLELFTGDGNIQGVFFDKGELTFIKRFIHTEKLIYEEENGRMPKNSISMIFFMLLSKLNIMPNILGLANTAIINIKENTYALFERDRPYQIDIDFTDKEIRTVNKTQLHNINHISGHSKYSNNVIETIEYDVISKNVNYYTLDEFFNVINKTTVPTKYTPITHDFLSTENSIILTDSPTIISKNTNAIKNFILKTVNNSIGLQKTMLHIINKRDYKVETLECPDSFYLFHYANYLENADYIEIYASMYDTIDFSSLNIKGKYRKIVIDKKTKSIQIDKNSELEAYNLDFPVKYKNKIVLRNIENNKINGFVICEGLEIKHKIFFEDKYICGEPAIINIEFVPHLISFAEDGVNSYLFIINLWNYELLEMPIQHKLNLGFHSIFIENGVNK